MQQPRRDNSKPHRRISEPFGSGNKVSPKSNSKPFSSGPIPRSPSTSGPFARKNSIPALADNPYARSTQAIYTGDGGRAIFRRRFTRNTLVFLVAGILATVMFVALVAFGLGKDIGRAEAETTKQTPALEMSAFAVTDKDETTASS